MPPTRTRVTRKSPGKGKVTSKRTVTSKPSSSKSKATAMKLSSTKSKSTSRKSPGKGKVKVTSKRTVTRRTTSSKAKSSARKQSSSKGTHTRRRSVSRRGKYFAVGGSLDKLLPVTVEFNDGDTIDLVMYVDTKKFTVGKLHDNLITLLIDYGIGSSKFNTDLFINDTKTNKEMETKILKTFEDRDGSLMARLRFNTRLISRVFIDGSIKFDIDMPDIKRFHQVVVVSLKEMYDKQSEILSSNDPQYRKFNRMYYLIIRIRKLVYAYIEYLEIPGVKDLIHKIEQNALDTLVVYFYQQMLYNYRNSNKSYEEALSATHHTLVDMLMSEYKPLFLDYTIDMYDKVMINNIADKDALKIKVLADIASGTATADAISAVGPASGTGVGFAATGHFKFI